MAKAVTLNKLEQMKEMLRTMGHVAVAFSAGVDSTFLLKVAIDTLGRNTPDRCYHCKSTLYEHARQYLRDRGGSHTVLTGTNADDLGDWRPGIKAAEEYGVRAPLAEGGLTKEEIRVLSREWGLPTSDKPASPCLASRVAYGEEITAEVLHMIEEAERFLRRLGLRELRVRHHGRVARIEVVPEKIAELAKPEVRERIDAHLRKLGYAYVALDLRGFRSGSLNEVHALGKPASRA